MKAEAHDIFLYVQTEKGHLMQRLGAYEETLKIHSFTLKIADDVLSKDQEDDFYQSILLTNLDSIFTLGNLFYSMGLFFQAKRC